MPQSEIDPWHFQTSEVIFCCILLCHHTEPLLFDLTQSAMWFKLPAGTTENHFAPTAL